MNTHTRTKLAAGIALALSTPVAGMMLTRDDPTLAEGRAMHRTITLDRKGMDAEARTVPAALSSESEVPRWFGREKLVHTDEAIDLSRARDGLPLLFNHNRDVPIGVVRDLKVVDGVLRGVLHFSNNARAGEIWGDVREGFLRDISIGYRILKFEESADDDLVTVTRWELFESSVVTIPADRDVGINRDDPAMPAFMLPQRQPGAMLTREDDPSAGQGEYDNVRRLSFDQGQAAGIKAESERRAGIARLFLPERFRGGEFDALRTAAEDGGWSVTETTDRLLELVGRAGAGPLGGGGGVTQAEDRGGREPSVSAGDDSIDKFVRGAELAICVRSRIITEREPVAEARGAGFMGMTLSELAREYLRIAGVDTRGLVNRDQIVRRALEVRGIIAHGTSDFAAIVENVATKALLMGWTETPETWNRIARVGNLPDFKQASRVGLSEFSNLEIVRENGEYKTGDMSDRKEVVQLLTYGRLFGISRQAIVNDDTDAFTMVPRKMGRAAQRKVGDLVYAVLTGNPTLNQDSTALFHADHSNLGTGGAPSVTTVSEARKLMKLQTDGESAAAGLNIPLSRLIVPVTLEDSASVLAASEYDPADTNNSRAPNPVRGFEVVADPRLDADSTAQWYASADPQLYDTIECAFLDGQTEPFIETQDGWSTDGVQMKVRIDAAAIPLDFRGLVRNAGS